MNTPTTMRALRACLKNVRGVCLTFYVNGCDRGSDNPRRRPCLVAYVGHGRRFKSRRFMIDTFGIALAFSMALNWRRYFSDVAPHVRTCDVRRTVRASISRVRK